MAKNRTFPALRATLAGLTARSDPKVAREVEARLARAERLAESRLRTIKRLLDKLRACRVEGRKLAATEKRLRALLAEAREVIRESGAVQEANAAILDAERDRRLAAEAALADCRSKLPSEADGPIGGLLSKLGK